MKTTSQREEPAKRPASGTAHGAPTTFAAYATRKDLAVRVTVQSLSAESDELREHGYGHGV